MYFLSSPPVQVILSAKVKNTIKMMSLFQREFSCRAIVFTTDHSIQEFCNSQHVATSSEFKTNPYRLPYIGSLFETAAAQFKAHFYGYINSDILVSTEIFSVLPFVLQEKRRSFPEQLVGFACAVE